MNKRIIVIDDDESILKDYQIILAPERGVSELEERAAALEAELFGETPEKETFGKEYYELTTALQGKEGFVRVRDARAEDRPFSLAFVDIRMPPGWDGVRTASAIREVDPDIEIVIVTAYSDRDRSEIVDKVGVPERLLYLKKPFDPEEIRQLALCLTRKWNLERRAERHQGYLKRLLRSVRRLKTLNISSVRDVLSAVLSEVLSFVDARKGFIARLNKGEISVEINSENLSSRELGSFMEKVSERLPDIETISWIGNIMVFPLRDGFGNFFVLVSDFHSPVHDERFELLRLLLETSSEVLESVKKQERFLKNEKIATIGQIATGIIHEINNPLMAIMGAADLFTFDRQKMWRFFDICQDILKSPEIPPDTRKNFGELVEQVNPENIRRKMEEHHSIIRDGAERISGLMENIRSLSKSGEHPEMNPRNVGEILENTLLLAHNALKYGITVHKEWAPSLPVLCDVSSLKQMFLNLILNAVQAMEGVGELWIRGKKRDGKILVSIEDSGPGMSRAEKDRIFEAFYTTKPDGTGLGLSIVKGIIDSHNGVIRVESELGRGTAFHMEFLEQLQTSEVFKTSEVF
ncbi:ATP-binding protein [Desulfobacterales bacterium HSG2]|nr:ATP-binding protein [Desulfobacterales bacterium HSG2]